MTEREYAYCTVCGNVVYRTPGHHHGDGQIDMDDAPVWLLLGDIDEARHEGIDVDSLPDVQCGCSD